ncbi:hypothetical protein [Pseudooceanicola nanhaiensis]|uniref:hypothetical protein n=1 Tax=Pseudooceanicola nanhaiensis TaxID=375761 RepID=UPI001CD45085|nr:hypothetical protein [Pseudooceanicola nanhaiensis]MCA0922316.1 hypothetical protein [Pseudooceanicola nanhaiensis]
MKICISGRSHMVALKNAIEEGKFDTAGDEYVFIGASGKAYKNDTYVEDGILRARGAANKMFLQTSNGQYDRLDPQDFDVVVLYGTPVHVQALFASILRAGNAESEFSSAYLRRATQKWFEAQPTLATIRAMRARSDTPIVFKFEPFFSEKYAERMPEGRQVSSKTRDIVFAALRESVEEAGATCVFQPESTIANVIYSPHELSIGSRPMAGEGSEQHDDDDVTHLNSSYGAIALKELRGTIQKLVA